MIWDCDGCRLKFADRPAMEWQHLRAGCGRYVRLCSVCADADPAEVHERRCRGVG
jgi:hypothetical protein